MSEPTINLSLDQAHNLVTKALIRAGTDEFSARLTADALVDAQAQGLASHGLSRVPQYVSLLGTGRADPNAQPQIIQQRDATVLVDAQNGLAFPACALAVETAVSKAATAGACVAAVTNSHHFGVAAWHLNAVGKAGMIGLAMGNSPAAMPVPGGKRALLGTNPLAACFPRSDAPPMMIDLSLSEVARGKIMVAAREGKPIPLGWALDANGLPTTNAKAALAGSMLPVGSGSGSAKGGMLALLIELLVVSLTGAHFGAEADSFFETEGNQPRLAQCFIVINPAAMAGTQTYQSRVEALIDAMLQDDTVRLPGARRHGLYQAALTQGVSISQSLYDQIRGLNSA